MARPPKQPTFNKRFAKRRSKSAVALDTVRDIFSARRPPDVASLRAKSTRHRKVTADRWNQ
jgi:hypothetical protein